MNSCCHSRSSKTLPYSPPSLSLQKATQRMRLKPPPAHHALNIGSKFHAFKKKKIWSRLSLSVLLQHHFPDPEVPRLLCYCCVSRVSHWIRPEVTLCEWHHTKIKTLITASLSLQKTTQAPLPSLPPFPSPPHGVKVPRRFTRFVSRCHFCGKVTSSTQRFYDLFLLEFLAVPFAPRSQNSSNKPVRMITFFFFYMGRLVCFFFLWPTSIA